MEIDIQTPEQIAQDYKSNEDMTAVNAAIVAGKAYVA